MESIILPGQSIGIKVENLSNLEDSESSMRLDMFLAQNFAGNSRSLFQKLIDHGFVEINGNKAKKHSISVKLNDIITVNMPERQPAKSKHEANISAFKDIKTIFEQEHFLIIYKPAGLLVHKANKDDQTPNLVDWLMLNHNEIGSVGIGDRPGIVHRLDKDTSGIMIIARSSYGHAIFSDMFKDRLIHKKYQAVVNGHTPLESSIDFNIKRHPVHSHKMVHTNGAGRASVTHYKTLKHLNNASLIEASPVTGRTHQIRVHFAAISHPLIGDAVYGSSSDLISRQALHAYQLEFNFLGQDYKFTQEAPEDINNLIDKLSTTI